MCSIIRDSITTVRHSDPLTVLLPDQTQYKHSLSCLYINIRQSFNQSDIYFKSTSYVQLRIIQQTY